MSIATKNQERLAGIIAEIVTALGIDVGDCNLGPGPDICALGDEAVAASKYRPSSTPSGRAEELITQLEAEIVKRDALIADLEAQLEDTESRRENAARNSSAFEDRMGDLRVENGKLHARVADLEAEAAQKDERISIFESNLPAWGSLRLELAALKEQQRGGVVLPERDNENEGNSYSVMQAMARNQALDEVARLNPPRPVPEEFYCESKPLQELLNATAMLLETPCADSATYWAAQLANVEAFLNPPGECVAVPRELLELEWLRAFHRCCAGITEQMADSPKSAFARLVEAVKDTAQHGKAGCAGDEKLCPNNEGFGCNCKSEQL